MEIPHECSFGVIGAIFDRPPLSRLMGVGWGAKTSKKLFPIFSLFSIRLLTVGSWALEYDFVLILT